MLFLDCEPEVQPNGTYRYMINQVDDSSTGAQGASVSEQGNEIAVTLDGKLLGSRTIERYKHILFTNDNAISLFNSRDNTLEVLVQLDDFNFGPIVKCEHRIFNGCEDVIYFYDNVNPDRQFNISRPNNYKTDNVFDVNKFNLNPDAFFPSIDAEVFPSGGSLELGKYFFAVQVVDESENIVYTSQLEGGVSITDDEDGGLNIATNLPQIGGISKSNKSVRLKVTNIGDYPYVRLVVFRAATADGITFDSFRVGQLYAVTDGVSEFTFTGYNPTQDVFVTPQEIIVPRARYQKSKAHTQVDSILLRANLTETVRDYSNYQKFASKIKAEYITTDVPKSTSEVITELGGEVKAYGVCYVHEDGTISPPCHIPGRVATDEDLLPVDIDFAVFSGEDLFLEVDLSHQHVDIGGTLWSEITIDYTYSLPVDSSNITLPDGVVVNTGTTGSVTHLLQYIDTFPIDLTFQFNAVIGNANYEILTGLYVPSTVTLEVGKLSSSSTVPVWKVQSTASNGNLGYYETEEIYTNPPNFCGEDYWGVDSEGNSLYGTNVRYHVIPDRSTEPLMLGDKLRKIGVKFTNIEYPSDDIIGHFFVSNIREAVNSLVVGKGLTVNYNHENMNHPLYNYEQGRYFQNVSGSQITSNNLNHFINNESLFNKALIKGQYVLKEGLFTINKFERDYNYNNYFDNTLPYRDLALYEKNHDVADYSTTTRSTVAIKDAYLLNSQSSYKGIKNSSQSSFFNVLSLNNFTDNTFKYVSVREFKTVFQSVWNIRYRRIGNLNQNLIFNGDAFISKTDITNISWLSVNRPFLAQNTIKYEFELIRNLYTESTINSNYRHGGTDSCNTYWTPFVSIPDFIINKVIEEVDNKPIAKNSICKEFYGYNRDYSFVNKFNTFTPLLFTHNFCSDCLGLYPTRIIFSEKSFNEDQVDNYRVFLANNYVDLPANTGEIVSMNYYNGKLVVRTTNSCFFLQPNPQQLQLSETTAYIGTGDFLSLPPQELNVTDIGYAGQQGVISEVITENGLIWVDALRGKVYKLTDKLDEISRKGLYHWFKNNLPTDAVLTYDPEYERVLFTANDYTLSYSFKQQGWKSFHSYVPERYFYNGDTFFSVVDNGVWKHQSNKYFTFYDRSVGTGVEFTFPNSKAFGVSSVQYYAKTQVYNPSTQQWEDVNNITFDKGWVFNSNQSSGLFDITVNNTQYGNVAFSNVTKHVTLTDKVYKLSGVYNLATSSAIFSRLNSYDIIPVNIDVNLPQYQLAPFRDKFIRVRLLFTNPDYRIITNVVDTLKYEYER